MVYGQPARIGNGHKIKDILTIRQKKQKNCDGTTVSVEINISIYCYRRLKDSYLSYTAPYNLYWFLLIDNKHMAEPWLDQALMESAYKCEGNECLPQNQIF